MPLTVEKSNIPPKTTKASGEAILAKSVTHLKNNLQSLSKEKTKLPSLLVGIAYLIPKTTRPITTPIISGLVTTPFKVFKRCLPKEVFSFSF